MKTISTIENLDESYVVILSEKYGTRFYQNSTKSKVRLISENPSSVAEQVLELWGDTPTVEDYIPEDLPQSPPSPTTEERIISAQQTITTLDLALIVAEQSITDNDLRLLALEGQTA